VEVSIDGVSLVTPDDGDCTVSAAAIYLLRTLSQSHTAASRVGDHLFPCCGTMLDAGGPDVLIIGCLGGSDFDVQREGDRIVLTHGSGAHEVSFRAWSDAVCDFSDSVRAFYDRSLPRQPSDEDDAKALRAFLTEWTRRRESASA